MGKINELVDRGYKLDAKIKELKKEFDSVKDEIKKYCQKNGSSEVAGTIAVATASAYTTSYCEPNDLLEKLSELGREEEFTNLVTVAVGPTKKALGEMIFEEIADIQSKPFHVVKFKKAS